MRDPSINPSICNVDPVSASILALGSAAGGAAAGGLPLLFGGGQASPPPASAPPPPAPPIQQPQGTRDGTAAATSNAGTSAPSFIGSSSLPQQQGYGSKTLLGQ